MNKIQSLVVAETTSWYDKKGEMTFIDIIAVVRLMLYKLVLTLMRKNKTTISADKVIYTKGNNSVVTENIPIMKTASVAYPILIKFITAEPCALSSMQDIAYVDAFAST